MARKYFGRWGNYEGVTESWFGSVCGTPGRRRTRPELPETFPKKGELLFASYGGDCYDGDAVLIWERDGKLYETHGSHCSCYGLEDQFSAEETSWAALAMREHWLNNSCWYFLNDHDADAAKTYWRLVDARVPPAPRGS